MMHYSLTNRIMVVISLNPTISLPLKVIRHFTFDLMTVQQKTFMKFGLMEKLKDMLVIRIIGYL